LKKEKVFNVFLVIVSILTVILCVWAHGYTVKRDHDDIHQWAIQNNYEVVEIHFPGILESHPFFGHDEGDRIYLATLRDSREKERISGFKFNFFGLEQKWK
jgi:hypothetical protein